MSSLKFLLDENVPEEVKEFLEVKEFPAKYPPKGITNSEIASLSKGENLVLLTRDTDFLNAAFFRPKEFPGIVVFRIHPPKVEKLVRAMSLLLEEVKDFKAKTFAVDEEGFKVIEL